MRKGIIVFGLMVVLVLSVSALLADNTAPQPGTPTDNECYPGGVLYRAENQDGCPTMWYWKAGWYLARFNRGIISRENFPQAFASVLPPLPKPTTEPLDVKPTRTCEIHFDDPYATNYGASQMVSVPFIQGKVLADANLAWGDDRIWVLHGSSPMLMWEPVYGWASFVGSTDCPTPFLPV